MGGGEKGEKNCFRGLAEEAIEKIKSQKGNRSESSSQSLNDFMCHVLPDTDLGNDIHREIYDWNQQNDDDMDVNDVQKMIEEACSSCIDCFDSHHKYVCGTRAVSAVPLKLNVGKH